MKRFLWAFALASIVMALLSTQFGGPGQNVAEAQFLLPHSHSCYPNNQYSYNQGLPFLASGAGFGLFTTSEDPIRKPG